MDAYTMHLLRLLLSHDRAGWCGLHIWPNADTGGPSVHLSLHDDQPIFNFSAETLEEAIRDALTELGVEVPERPSAKKVARCAADFAEVALYGPEGARGYLRGLYAREPLTVIAMLEGEA